MSFLWKKLVKSVVKRGIQAFLSAYVAHLLSVGIKVDEVALTVAIFSGLEALRNYLKHKFGWKFL